MKKSDFNYRLPSELIAQKPLQHRRDSRLLWVKKHTGERQDRLFKNFLSLLQPDDLLVFNDTKVMAARLRGHKETGGQVEILIERILNHHEVLAQIKASKTSKIGTVIQLEASVNCQVVGRKENLFKLHFQGKIPIMEILEKIGHIPLPPYIKREEDDEDLERYQTVFATQLGAVAAPTAGLHFDDQMLQQLNNHNIATAFVTLHVGSGTFQPVRVENLAEHRMHKEYFNVEASTISKIKKTKARGGRVIAIGTTAVRALESASQEGELKPSFGDTRLFITPGYEFKTVDAMLTNFHLPESTLLMLISAFAGYESIMSAYHHAIKKKYRFFSYGDAMFLST